MPPEIEMNLYNPNGAKFRTLRATLSYEHALPPEARIAELLPEPAVFHIIEVPPLHVAIDEKDVSPGGIRACFQMVRPVIDLPSRPAAAGRPSEIGLFPVRAVAGGHVGDKLHRGGGTFRCGDGSDPFLGC